MALCSPLPSVARMFRKASNIAITGGQFISIDNAGTQDAVSTTLWPHVAHCAIFNSAQRYPAGKCHPGTRLKVIKMITDWINESDPTEPILWLYGPAGSGKSALAHTICEILDKSESTPPRSLYSCSFFFARGPTDSGNSLQLFTTLSYQLAVQFPAMRTEINKALSQDSSLPTKSMELQLLSLIVQPLLHCQSLLSHRPILIIDGLDECAEDEDMTTQRDIVTLIAKSVVDYNLPLLFMIASRPEYWIRDAFDTLPMSSIACSFSLQEDADADKDIKGYLVDGFEKIRVENKRVMASVVPPWPAPNIINHFVYEASGQYIYASTVLKFVGKSSRFSNPQEQLRIITSPGPSRALAFSELDRLYVTILSSYPRWETMKLVLEGILIHCNTTIISVVLGVDYDELVLVLDALSSLIDIEEPEYPDLLEDELILQSIFGPLLDGQHTLAFCHLSFREFLEDETRSGTFHIKLEEIRNKILEAFFQMIHRNLDQNYEIEPRIFLNIDIATYDFVMREVASSSNCVCGYTIGKLLPHITHMTQRLLFPSPRGWMNFLPCFIDDMGSLDFFVRDLFHRNGNPRFSVDEEEPQNLDQFRTACHKLRGVVSQAKIEASRALPLRSEFKVTPTLVYLTEYHEGLSVSLDVLSAIPGTTDIVSTITTHRHIIGLRCLNDRWTPWRVDLNDAFDIIWEGKETHSTIQREWKDQRSWLAYRLLQSLFFDRETKVSPEDDHELEDDDDDNRCAVLAKYYFGSKGISDIHTKEYFETRYDRLILESVTDLSAWIRVLETQMLPKRFITSIICWLNRQLTNPQTLRLLQDHDDTLKEKMTTAMKTLFKHGFLPQFNKSYEKQLRMFGWNDHHSISITMAVLPLPQGYHQKEQILSIGVNSVPQYSKYWRLFHDNMFGEPSGGIEDGSPTIIDCSRWHPYLASRLLNVLVKHLYGQIHPRLKFGTTSFEVSESLPYMAQCLPYAQPTKRNLEALRALVYLYPQLPTPLSLPEGFWPLIVEFLRKYDRSVLSFEELELFEAWLLSTDRSDIKNYVNPH